MERGKQRVRWEDTTSHRFFALFPLQKNLPLKRRRSIFLIQSRFRGEGKLGSGSIIGFRIWIPWANQWKSSPRDGSSAYEEVSGSFFAGEAICLSITFSEISTHWLD